MILRLVQFNCDDHGHDDEEESGGYRQPLQVIASTLAAGKAEAAKKGWTFHRDGRTFCGECNKRLKATAGEEVR